MTVEDSYDNSVSEQEAPQSPGLMDERKLNELFNAYGIAETYVNYSGQTVTLPIENKLRIIGLMDINPLSEDGVETALHDISDAIESRWLPPAVVLNYSEQTQLDLHFVLSEMNEKITWELETESGEWLTGSFIPQELTEKSHFVFDENSISVRQLPIPSLGVGYHKISLKSEPEDGLSIHATKIVSDLIVTPASCYRQSLDDASGVPKKSAGISIQLYSLRSNRDWGVGDFSDLQLLIENLVNSGIDFVVLNPLHLLDANYPENCSPYSPLDRRRLNPIYISPDLSADFYENERLQEIVRKPEYQQRLREIKDSDFVDYTAVTEIKYTLYSKMFSYFKSKHLDVDSPRGKAFRHYLSEQSQSALAFAAYQAQHCELPYWHTRNPIFHSYLQWLAESQLEACQQLALRSGLSVGLIRDLAVGSGSGSIEVATNRNLFCLGASIGAPPDPLAPQGQNWGLPPMKPTVLKETGYRHFIELLQTNMSHCGALRIDHVMALLRLWWCPGNAHNEQGVYVYYPVDDLFAILRLESHRQQCVVIGEDLGVVPPEVRDIMARSGVLSNALFYFEKYDSVVFKRPYHQQYSALTMVSNHDVPTLTAWWNKTDVFKRKEIGLITNDDEFNQTIMARESDLIQIFHWLNDVGLLPHEWQDFNIHRPFDAVLCAAILAGNGIGASQLVSIQLDDLCMTESPVNIPGTCDEYPNWRRKLPLPLETIFTDSTAMFLLNSFVEARSRK